MRRTPFALAGSLLLLALASGCSSDDGGNKGADPKDGGTSEDTSQPLTFELTESTMGDQLASECTFGKWSENPTGVTGDQESNVTFFRQYDCWESEEAADSIMGGFPELIQQVIYAEFDSADAAEDYAEDQAILYRTIIDDKAVVVFGTGIPEATMAPYADALTSACGCETVTAD